MNTELLGDSVKSAISKQLQNIFPDTAIYREAFNLPLTFPHFFIHQVTVDVQEERNNYYWIDYLVNIRYRTADDPDKELGVVDLQSNLDATGLKLLAELDTVELFGRPRKIKDARYEKIDNVLHYFCNLNFSTVKPSYETEKQMSLEINLKN